MNFLAFQAGWFACAYSTIEGTLVPGATIVGVALLLHFSLISESRMKEALAMICIGCIGVFADQILIRLNVFRLREDSFGGIWVAGWSLLFFANFSATLNASLKWLGRRQWLSVAFGFLGAPPTYYAGSRMGAIQLNDSIFYSMLGLGIAWAILTPLFFAVSGSLIGLNDESNQAGR